MIGRLGSARSGALGSPHGDPGGGRAPGPTPPVPLTAVALRLWYLGLGARVV